ncbi:FAD-dependent oxidoreductase [Hymenobacter rubripertinctus]|uniref:FAD-dependent oxidoreductase n=1 Tax=Hymenobacter rubripertinctus TaxID=2029981 RepID=A0A418QS34_9BACT|nr:FAD-dependent oxidoreductase [Hymenobacter rubripertinctus]RIY07830.1 FAD-dependent oxidoreductase [Hymenobacter rubripertinctus]
MPRPPAPSAPPEESALIRDYDYLIVGGGAAGLSLAYHISQEPRLAGKRVVLVEPEESPRNDRTWRFWSDEPSPYEAIIAHQWNHMMFRTPQLTRRIALGQYRYRMLRSLDFYQLVYRTLDERPTQFVRLVGRVTGLQEVLSGSQARVLATLADGTQLQARYAFDSRLPKLAPDPRRHLYLQQHFVGWEIETDEDTFDVSTMQFMDFDIEQHQQVRFVYSLPFSPRRALVEFTVFSPELLAPAEYDEALRQYLTQHLSGQRYRITGRESGSIPMTSHPLPARVSARILNLGTRAGRAKPSTGYTFARIQRHSAHLVAALAASGHPPANPTTDQWQFPLFDTLLLDIMQRRGESVRDIFQQLFTRNPVERIFRFLDERTTPLENLQIMNSVTPWPFLRSIWHLVRRRPGQRGE